MAKAIMIQGTMSNAGKSFFTAALCRIFVQDGYKTAPFKSQNMALNSYITEEGLEMGRAQVMQAEACKIKPSVRMNPILLKPTSDVGSQVIVNGEARGNMRAAEYFQYKKELIPDIISSYETLAKEYDIIVIEGAGSPAEINLKSEDIVNMGMAKLARAPVLLVGDIDRGGVFAQLLGTVILLEEEEKAYIKGLVINKFRGDESLLKPGLTMLEDKCGIPVLSVVPYMQVRVDDEDSLSDQLKQNNVTAPIDIAVISLPHISNFTDFNALAVRKEISVRYVNSVRELREPDLIIIPGTKNTIADLKWLRQNGLESVIKRQAEQGTFLLGICGGYQMLGSKIKDPQRAEEGGEIRGMDLLPMETVFTKEKIRTRVKGEVLSLSNAFSGLSGSKVEGYEIHMGTSVTDPKKSREIPCFPMFQIWEDSPDDSLRQEGLCTKNIGGTYLHGLFDTDSMADAFVKLLSHKKGLHPQKENHISYAAYKEEQYDKMADELRKHIDMKRIYQILDEGIMV